MDREDREIRESERRLIQKELFLLEDQKDAAERRFRVMFENALVGLFRGVVATRELTDANREAARIFGFDEVDELIRWVNSDFDTFAFFNLIPSPRDLDPGKPYTFSAKAARPDGREIWIQFSIRYTGEGKLIEGAVKDITDQVESLNSLKQAKAEAEEANEAKSRFLATMSHEIRTPLNGIIGYAEILQDRDDPKSREYSRKILDESDRLMILINQLLDISKLEANKIILEGIELDLHQLIDEIDSSFRQSFEMAGLAYHCRIADDVPRLYIGDPMRLRQVITNLLSNALKFTREGSIKLNITNAGEVAGIPLIRFSVKDTGIGIPREKQDSIFSSFVQADSSISRRYGGSGLGVSICRQLVELMGGTLELDSLEGVGSDFHFTVPMILPPESEDESPDHRERPGTGTEWLAGRSALVVEDYETNREIARHHLEKAGCRVFHAVDGVDAIEFLSTGHTVDLIIMDVHMPRMDGLETTRSLRDAGIDTPVIGMTASAYAEDRARCLESGMDDFITKPIRRAALLSKAADWVVAGRIVSGESSKKRFESIDLTGNAPLRYNDLLEELGGEVDLTRELLDGFLDDTRHRLEKARNALAAGDFQTLHREAHSIKGGAMNIMADELAKEAFEVEKLARDEAGKVVLETCLDDMAAAWHRFASEWKGIRVPDDTR